MEIFKKYANQLIWLGILALSIVVIGCGGGGSASGTTIGGATTAPTVISTVPDNNVTAVPSNRKITATFSTAMDAATLTASTFTLASAGGSVSGTVAYYGKIAVFTPDTNLTNSTLYTATITTGAKNVAGTALAANHVWTFTTGVTPDTTAPDVNTTNPLNSATGVAINRDITATFSEHMDPADINTTTFTLVPKLGGAPIVGVVSYIGTTATFNPTVDLNTSTDYNATITTGVKDLAGNAMAAIKVWTFQTGATAAAGPDPVLLGTAGNFVLLAKTSISVADVTTHITGDIGVSPAAASYITGFTLGLDGSGTFSTSGLVTGKVYAADYAAPTPAYMTTAIGDMQIAFTDAAGRSNPDYTELYAGDISGRTLVPGLYKWGTGVLITNAGVTLTGGANDVWIFQIAQNLTVNNGAIITLSGGAQAKNVFWQVSGEATLGTTADFKGIILSQTLVSFNTGAKLTGRALAQTAVTLIDSNITAP